MAGGRDAGYLRPVNWVTSSLGSVASAAAEVPSLHATLATVCDDFNLKIIHHTGNTLC